MSGFGALLENLEGPGSSPSQSPAGSPPSVSQIPAGSPLSGSPKSASGSPQARDAAIVQDDQGNLMCDASGKQLFEVVEDADALKDKESEPEMEYHIQQLEFDENGKIVCEVIENWDMMRKAVEKRDFPYIRSHSWSAVDIFGWTILHFAADNDAKEVILLLMDDCPALFNDFLEKPEKDLQTPLHVAAKAQATSAVRVLIAARANLAARDFNGFTPLIGCAIHARGISTVSAIASVAGKEIVDAGDKEGRTAMHWATLHGHLETCKTLICNAASLNQKDVHGLTPVEAAQDHRAQLILVKEIHEINLTMLDAAKHKQTEIVAECLRKGAQLDAVDDAGWSALMWAAINSKIDLLVLLIKKGASVHLKDHVGRTVADYAASVGDNQKILEELFQCNNRLVRAAEISQSVKPFLETKAFPDFVPNTSVTRWTPLMWAAFTGHSANLELLLQAKGDPLKRDISGENAIFVGIRGQADVKMCKRLWKAGDDVAKELGMNHADEDAKKKKKKKKKDDSGEDENHKTDEADGKASARELMGNNFRNRNFMEESMIHLAVIYGKPDIIRWLLSKDQELLKLKDRDGKTPFIIACQKGHAECVKTMLEWFCEVKMLDGSGPATDFIGGQDYNYVADLPEEYEEWPTVSNAAPNLIGDPRLSSITGVPNPVSLFTHCEVGDADKEDGKKGMAVSLYAAIEEDDNDPNQALLDEISGPPSAPGAIDPKLRYVTLPPYLREKGFLNAHLELCEVAMAGDVLLEETTMYPDGFCETGFVKVSKDTFVGFPQSGYLIDISVGQNFSNALEERVRKIRREAGIFDDEFICHHQTEIRDESIGKSWKQELTKSCTVIKDAQKKMLKLTNRMVCHFDQEGLFGACKNSKSEEVKQIGLDFDWGVANEKLIHARQKSVFNISVTGAAYEKHWEDVLDDDGNPILDEYGNALRNMIDKSGHPLLGENGAPVRASTSMLDAQAGTPNFAQDNQNSVEGEITMKDGLLVTILRPGNLLYFENSLGMSTAEGGKGQIVIGPGESYLYCGDVIELTDDMYVLHALGSEEDPLEATAAKKAEEAPSAATEAGKASTGVTRKRAEKIAPAAGYRVQLPGGDIIDPLMHLLDPWTLGPQMESLNKAAINEMAAQVPRPETKKKATNLTPKEVHIWDLMVFSVTENLDKFVHRFCDETTRCHFKTLLDSVVDPQVMLSPFEVEAETPHVLSEQAEHQTETAAGQGAARQQQEAAAQKSFREQKPQTKFDMGVTNLQKINKAKDRTITYNTIEGNGFWNELNPLQLAVKAKSCATLIGLLNHRFERAYISCMLHSAPSILMMACDYNCWDIVNFILRSEVRIAYMNQGNWAAYLEGAVEICKKKNLSDIRELLQPFKRYAAPSLEYRCYLLGLPWGLDEEQLRRFLDKNLEDLKPDDEDPDPPHIYECGIMDTHLYDPGKTAMAWVITQDWKTFCDTLDIHGTEFELLTGWDDWVQDLKEKRERVLKEKARKEKEIRDAKNAAIIAARKKIAAARSMNMSGRGDATPSTSRTLNQNGDDDDAPPKHIVRVIACHHSEFAKAYLTICEKVLEHGVSPRRKAKKHPHARMAKLRQIGPWLPKTQRDPLRALTVMQAGKKFKEGIHLEIHENKGSLKDKSPNSSPRSLIPGTGYSSPDEKTTGKNTTGRNTPVCGTGKNTPAVVSPQAKSPASGAKAYGKTPPGSAATTNGKTPPPKAGLMKKLNFK